MYQNLFPVIHSIPDSAALIKEILSKYSISYPQSCKLYKRGLNDTYLVETDTEKYILRAYRCKWRNKEEINFELKVLDFLRTQNQPVAYPIACNDSSFTLEINAPEGIRYISVFSYAPGTAANEKINSTQSYNLGKTLAQIHAALDNFKTSYRRRHLTSEYLLDWAFDAIKTLYAYRTSDINYLQTHINKIKSQLEELKLPLSVPEYGICVGDVHSGNAHFTEDNKPTLFDFDQCGYGWRSFDIAKCLHVAIRQNIEIQIRNNFTEGYQSFRPLSEAELLSIPVLIKAAHIWVMGINTNAVGDVLPYGWFDDTWLDGRLNLLRQLDENKVLV